MEAAANPSATPLGFVLKLRVFLACLVAVLVHRQVGWLAAEPLDPDMAVSLAYGGRSVLAVGPALLLLTAVTASIGTVIIGRRLPEGGVFAAAIGLASLALHGGSMQQLLGYYAGTEPASRRAVMMALARETLLWSAILAVAWVVAVLTWRWLWGARGEESDEPKPPPTRKGAKMPSASARPPAGWIALVVTGIIGVVVVWLLVSRTPVATVARGQVIASVALGLFLGAMAARYFTGIADPRWYALAPLGVALIAYLMGYLNAGFGWATGTAYQAYAQLATTPPHDLVRALPIEYLAVGLAGAVAGFWSGERIEHPADQEST